MNYYIKDNVCVPYKLILSRVNNFLLSNNWTYVDSENDAEICIIGTCGAFHSLKNESIENIQSARKNNTKIIVFGCLVKIAPEEVQSLKPDITITSSGWKEFEKIVYPLRTPLSKVLQTSEFVSINDYRLFDPSKKFIYIQTGCSSDCPYCPHKLGIGALKSRPETEILEQVKLLTENGANTIVLHGNDTGAYGTDLGNISFPQLLKKILPFSPILHLTQINSDWAYLYKDELFKILNTEKKIKEFQVLIQTSSNRLLNLMKRKPVVNNLYPYLKELKKNRRDIILRTDIIIGYPTSTINEEQKTLEYLTDIFDEVAVHAFERFPHTEIEKMGLPFFSQDEIDDRLNKTLEYLKEFPEILVHRGGQVYETMLNIEKPKDKLRKRNLLLQI